jgi:hypothetical protein
MIHFARIREKKYLVNLSSLLNPLSFLSRSTLVCAATLRLSTGAEYGCCLHKRECERMSPRELEPRGIKRQQALEVSLTGYSGGTASKTFEEGAQ